MKKIVIVAIILLAVACKNKIKEPIGNQATATASASIKTPEALGKEIFEDRGNCFSCHLPEQKLIGPSLQEIAKIYKDKKGDIVSFLKGEATPIVDPSQYEVMKTNFPITEEMSDEELKALEAYVYSNLK